MVQKFGGLNKILARFASLKLFHIVIAALIARIFLWSTLPNSPSPLGPDEGTYANLAKWVERGDPVLEYPSYGPGLYNSSRSFIWPSVLLIRLGLSPLDSVRFTSIIYGVLTIYIFGKFVFAISENCKYTQRNTKAHFSIPIISLFAFFPSSFLWSVLGLRESASTFWVILSCFLLFLVVRPKVKVTSRRAAFSRILLIVSVPLAVTFSFGARRETALVFLVFFLAPIVFAKKKMLLITSLFLTSFVSGHLFTMTPSAHVVVPKASITNVVSNSISNSALSVLPKIENKRKANTLNADTAISDSDCESYSVFLARVKCILPELPYRISSVLVRPLPVVDSGSLANNLASIENVLWLLLLASFVYSSFYLVKNKELLVLVLPTLLYVISFSLLSALYEGNLGTAFRHKTSILWPLLLMVSIYLHIQPRDRRF